jgi:hypothetical protein
MAARIADRLWSMEDVVAPVDEQAERRAPRLADRLVGMKPNPFPVIARLFLSTLLSIGGAAEAGAQTRDYGALTCRDFVSTGLDNKAVIMWWLRGHHAGKTGVNSFDPKDAYASRLGFFCGGHPGANLIETSEGILAELDRGI